MKQTSSKIPLPSSSLSALIAAASALIAIALHYYLLKSHYDLHYGEVAAGLICDISSRFSCSITSASKWSELFGVPMALWGILANLSFFVLFAWDFVAEPSGSSGFGQASTRTNLLATAAVLVGASVAMAAISFSMIQALCPFCIATYALSLLTGFFAWRAYRPGLNLTFKPQFLGFAAIAALAAFIINDQARSSYTGPGGDSMATAAFDEWKANPKIEIAETDPLAIGPSRENAKLTLIEFADFRCIHCKLASAPLKAFVASHPDVRLEYYSWPLDGECNRSIQQTNGASCLLARIVWCARNKSDKGWQAHELVFQRFEDWRTREAVHSAISDIATQTGVNPEELKTCSDSDEAKKAIEAQASLGSALNFRGTPAIFANGKLLPAGSSIPVLSKVYKSL